MMPRCQFLLVFGSIVAALSISVSLPATRLGAQTPTQSAVPP
jgi:hypothetical protein